MCYEAWDKSLLGYADEAREVNRRAVELAEEVFHMPVRLGSPQYVEGLMDVVRNPIHATGVGLLLYGYENLSRRGRRSTPVGTNMGDVWERMKHWFQKQF